MVEAGDCNEGCQNSATSLRAGFCQGNPLGEPSPSATPASENVHSLRGHPVRYVNSLELTITCGNLPRGRLRQFTPCERRQHLPNIKIHRAVPNTAAAAYTSDTVAVLYKIVELMHYPLPEAFFS